MARERNSFLLGGRSSSGRRTTLLLGRRGRKRDVCTRNGCRETGAAPVFDAVEVPVPSQGLHTSADLSAAWMLNGQDFQRCDAEAFLPMAYNIWE